MILSYYLRLEGQKGQTNLILWNVLKHWENIFRSCRSTFQGQRNIILQNVLKIVERFFMHDQANLDLF